MPRPTAPHGGWPGHSMLFQLCVGLYGGYFGAGIGILMLAALSILGLQDIHEMNSLKVIFGGSVNGIAAAYFIWARMVYSPYVLLMAVAASWMAISRRNRAADWTTRRAPHRDRHWTRHGAVAVHQEIRIGGRASVCPPLFAIDSSIFLLLSNMVKTKASEEQIVRYADMFSAMGTEARLRIMRLLLSAHPDGLVAGEIQSELGIPNSTLSHHLEKLKSEDLVKVRREGTFLWYTATRRRCGSC